MYYLLTEARAGKANNTVQRQEQEYKPKYIMSAVFQQQSKTCLTKDFSQEKK